MANRRVSLNLAGALMAPAVLVAFVFGMVVATGLNCGSGPAQAQSGSSIQLGGNGKVLAGMESPFVEVADEVVPMVVNIAAEKTVTRSTTPRSEYEGPFGEFFRHFFEGMPEMQQQRNSLGSGVIVHEDGYIVTNNHVVEEFDKIVVTLSDGTEFKGSEVEVVGLDSKTDLAVIKVDSDEKLPAIRMGEEEDIRVGGWAIAVGNPYGLQSTVTVGVVSAKGRSGIPLPEGPSYQDFIQTDASINPGNSGGALVNSKAELIGINSAIRSPVGANVGIGFAVPVGMVRTVVEQLIEHGKVTRGFLGIRPQPVTEAIREAMGLKTTGGVLVSEVLEDMPAEKAGLKAGDVIVQVNGKKTEDLEQFRRDMADIAPGTTVELTVIRDGKRLTKRAKLTEFPDDEQASAPSEPEETGWLGLSVRSLTAEDRQRTGEESGVMVQSVESGSAAADAGIQRGDVVVEVGDTGISGVSDFERAVKAASKGGRPVLFRVARGGSRFFVAVEPSE